MMDKETYLEKYLQDRLSPEERENFQRMIESDPELAVEVAFALELQEALARKEYERAKSELQSVSKSHRKFQLNKWAVAASIVLLIGIVGTLWYQYQYPINTDTLYAQYFEPYRNVVQPEVRGDQDPTVIADAFAAYDRGDFTSALGLFESMANTTPAIRLYKANCLLALERAGEAVVLLTEDLDIKDSFTRARHWYLAQGYLRQDKKQEAREVLLKMKQLPGTFKTKQVDELLGLLE